MKRIFIVLTIFSSAVFASKAVKVSDGTAAYCPEKTDQPQQYVLTYEMYDEKLMIKASVCVSGRWIDDMGFVDHTYKALNGQIVNEKFKSFKVMVLSPTNYSKYILFDANEFEQFGYVIVTKDQLSKLGIKTVDVNLQATRETTVDGQLKFVDPIWWGQIRVTLE